MASKSDQPPADDRVYDVGSFEAELFWEKNRSVILICMGVVLALAAAVVMWLFSARNARQAEENAGVVGWRLAEAEIAALDEASARMR